MNVCSAVMRITRIMIGQAPDERLGCQALHLSPGGDWWALSAYTRTNTDPGSRRALLYSDCWIPITRNSGMCMTNASQNATASGVPSPMKLWGSTCNAVILISASRGSGVKNAALSISEPFPASAVVSVHPARRGSH